MEFAQIANINDAKQKIGARIRNAIKDMGYTYRKVEEESGINRSHVSNLSNGKIMPTLETIFKLSKELHVDYKLMISGLELFIKPTGFNFIDENPSQDEEMRFQVEVEREYYRYIGKKYPTLNNEAGKSNIILQEIIEWKATDDSMDLLNIDVGSRVNVIKLAAKDPLTNGRVCLLKLDGKEIIRRIWKVTDKMILIPYTTNSKHTIEEFDVEEVQVVGIVDSVYTIIR